MYSRFDEFWEFHERNPEVYKRLVKLTKAARDKGYGRIGVKMLFEVLRWEHMMETDDPASEFKLNNNYHSYYARLIMSDEPDLDGMFELRALKTLGE